VVYTQLIDYTDGTFHFTTTTTTLVDGTLFSLYLLDHPQWVGYQDTKNYKNYVVRLDLGLMNMKQDLPLFLMDGLQIKITLNSSARPFRMTHNPTATAKKLNIELTDCRMLCSLRTPSAEIRDQYVEMFQKGMLNYPFVTYLTNQVPVVGTLNGRVEVNFPVSKSSIKKVFFFLQTSVERSTKLSELPHTDSFSADSYKYSNLALTQYQFKIGAQDYPNTPVTIPDKYARDAFTELLLSCEYMPYMTKKKRLEFCDWVANSEPYDPDLPSGRRLEPIKRIYATRFDTIDGDMLSGVKTRGIGTDDNVVAILNFESENFTKIQFKSDGSDSQDSPRYLYCLFEHSKTLHLSENGILALD
jgi:hypothetical protein